MLKIQANSRSPRGVSTCHLAVKFGVTSAKRWKPPEVNSDADVKANKICLKYEFVIYSRVYLNPFSTTTLNDYWMKLSGVNRSFSLYDIICTPNNLLNSLNLKILRSVQSLSSHCLCTNFSPK